MANFNLFAKKLYNLEGGFINHPADKGGPTNRGITLDTFRSFYGRGTIEDIKALTFDQFYLIAKKKYWDRWRADEIENQSIAEFLVDWVYNSGVWGIKIPQKVLGVPNDGVVGPRTIQAVNWQDSPGLFNSLKQAREDFYKDITRKSPSQLVFLKGWLKRNNSFKYT